MKKLLSLLLFVGLVFVPMQGAQAHPAADYFLGGGYSATFVYVHIVDTDGWFSTNVRNRIQDAIDEWNFHKANGAPFLTLSSNWGSVLACSQMNLDVTITRVDLGVGVYGKTDQCFHDNPGRYNGNLFGAHIKIDNDPDTQVKDLDWVADDCNGSYGSGQISFCGIITHELGHAEGYNGGFVSGGSTTGHFPPTETSTCMTGSWTTVHTMCGGEVWPAGQVWRQSSLEAHDIATWQNQY